MLLNKHAFFAGIFCWPCAKLHVASHILPWGPVRNGLSLSRLYVLLSPRLKRELPARAVVQNFDAYKGESPIFPMMPFCRTSRSLNSIE